MSTENLVNDAIAEGLVKYLVMGETHKAEETFLKMKKDSLLWGVGFLKYTENNGLEYVTIDDMEKLSREVATSKKSSVEFHKKAGRDIE